MQIKLSSLSIIHTLIVLFLVAALFFVVAFDAKAQDRASWSVDEVQALLNQLLNRANSLQQLVDTDGGSAVTKSDACSVAWPRDLKVGARGSDVMALQKFLNSDSDTVIAKTSYGSPGQETDYFGPATASAVARFQNKYSANILAPVGLAQGTGYVGAGTRREMNRLCAGGIVKPGPDTNLPTPQPDGLPYFKTLTVSASPTSIISGQSSTISWDAPEAGSCRGFDKTLSAKGSLSVSPAKTTSYTITCTGGELGSNTVTESVTVTVSLISGNTPTQKVLIDRNNIYSPEPYGTYLYFGGWGEAIQYNDNIYRASCENGNTCNSVQVVIDSDKSGFEHFNDPSIVKIEGTSSNGGRDYLVMYMTGVVKDADGFIPTNNDIYYATSWADDGVNWSTPRKLLDDHWLPSATINANGEVELYANDNGIHGNVTRINLGKSGISQQSNTRVNYGKVSGTDTLYANVYVQYEPNAKMYYILAERMNAPKAIDAFTSTDGINWTLSAAKIVTPAAGQVHVGTPAFDPYDPRLIYFGSTDQSNTTALKVRSVHLNESPF